MNLREWTVHYIKARDSMERKLKTMDEKQDSIVCHYRDRDVTFIPMEKLESEVKGNSTIVTVQNQQNFDTLIANFAAFSQNQNLTIIFVNLKLNEKWLIKPAVHASVADKSNLKAGLLSMYQAVPSQ